MVLAKGLRSQSRYCSAGTDKVDSRAVSTLEGRDLTAFVVSFASAMRQLECKSRVSPRGAPPRGAPRFEPQGVELCAESEKQNGDSGRLDLSELGS